jgi:hypothetical protein
MGVNFTKDQMVVVSNQRHSMRGRIGRVIVEFTKGVLTGKVLVHFDTFNNTFNPWEIEEIGEYNRRTRSTKVEIPNPIIHPAIYKDVD